MASLMAVPTEPDRSTPSASDASGSQPLVIGSIPPPPPPLEELPALLHRLHGHPAPRFLRDERGGLRRHVKRALNFFVLRFVGRSQQEFNQDLLHGLTLLMAEVRSLRRWSESLAGTPRDRPLDPIVQELATLRQRVAHLQDWMATELQDVGRRRSNRLEQLEGALDALGRRIDGLGTQDVNLLREFREGFASHAEWITVLQRKYQGVSLEARELTEPATIPEPRIVNPDAYARKVAAMGDAVRVNVGCGEKPMPGYVNVDLRALPDVDVVADAHRLPFEPGTLDELASAHLVEHFREHHARTRLLPYWKSLLRPDGRLRIVCPNWAVMLERLRDGKMTLHEFKLVTFGWQDYEGDDHFAMYTPETLRELLADVGFGRVEVITVDRMDGLCPEMELVAHP